MQIYFLQLFEINLNLLFLFSNAGPAVRDFQEKNFLVNIFYILLYTT